MFYRPNFCCHCGEKITRPEWTPLTSRRFCDFCAVEQKQHDLIPRVAAVLILLVGAAGLTAYIGSGIKPADPRARGSTEARQVAAAAPARQQHENNAANSTVRTNASQAVPPDINSAPAKKVQRAAPGVSSTETVYFCGATTKKGTPCTRRVKTPGRCWQHVK